MMAFLPSDHAERVKAITERERNVIVDAGAGTGKTTLLVERILHLLAPADDGPCFPLERLAAITFTRRAAGELKLRLRQALFATRGRTDLSELRASRLHEAVENLDTATIGTVHSFADRLLRMRPADARVSPRYEIAEDTDELVWETFHWLVDCIEHGTLRPEVTGTPFEELAMEAEQTVHAYQSAGFLMQSKDMETYTQVGLDWLVRDFISSRDRDLTVGADGSPDFARLRRIADELHRHVSDLKEHNTGNRVLRKLRDMAIVLGKTGQPGEALRLAASWSEEYRRAAEHLTQRDDFAGDPTGWDVWKWIHKGERGKGKSKEVRANGSLARELTEPLFGWLATRLVRLRPLVLWRYAELKRARQVVDQVDLLLELRNLVRSNLEARAFFQKRFDHIFVDEFQDTDPLQAEIILFLCEQGSNSPNLDQLKLANGKLTIVGDPKQSIYRFRRADITMYAEVCDRVRTGPVTESKLSVNFRSTPHLIEWTNQAFDDVLGSGDSGPLYDKQTGAVRNARLSPGRSPHEPSSVQVLSFGDDTLNAHESRDLEGEALARYLRWLVKESGHLINDPDTKKMRHVRYGDIAVLMVATHTVHNLLDELDILRVPHVVRGGTLFMQDPLHQQFVLGLRALSDREDGVAKAALMRPPFFAVDLGDLVRARVAGPDDPKPTSVLETEAIIRELRFTRHTVQPGEMARMVLEQTGFGRFVATMENGAQRLSRLYELCLEFGERARFLGLDFDGMTAHARGWIDSPVRMEAPLPVDADAVQVITVHQAKGLEWPVVALWDGRATWTATQYEPALTIDPMSGDWALALHTLRHDPTGRGMRTRELELLRNERKRVLYVAATRARDLLIVPSAGEPNSKYMTGKLLLSTANLSKTVVPAYQGGADSWARAKEIDLPIAPEPIPSEIEERWQQAAQNACEPYLAPSGVSAATHILQHRDDEAEVDPIGRKQRSGRYGPQFGSTVHRALELILAEHADEATALEWAVRETGLSKNIDAARADVQRTLRALSEHNLRAGLLKVEYPIAGSLSPDSLLAGYIDLLIVTPEWLTVIDFKTDPAPFGTSTSAYPGYAKQVKAYAELLARSGIANGRQTRSALLFTESGELQWIR